VWPFFGEFKLYVLHGCVWHNIYCVNYIKTLGSFFYDSLPSIQGISGKNPPWKKGFNWAPGPGSNNRPHEWQHKTEATAPRRTNYVKCVQGFCKPHTHKKICYEDV